MDSSAIIGTYHATYANIFSYMNLPLTRQLTEDVDAVVMGVPFDLATTARAGTRMGPNAIRQASCQLRWEERRWPWRFKLADKLAVVDYGDIDYAMGVPQDMAQKVTETAADIINAGKRLLSFGGDHFVTLPLLEAAYQTHGPLALIHFDAHTDTDEEPEFSYNHGSMFFHAQNKGIIATQNSIQVGIRTEYNYDDHQFEVLDGVAANNLSAEQIGLQIKQRVGDLPIYLSFDIDCLDPAYAPGTGTPVAGGISSDKALQILRQLVGLNIVAMDVMEVSPAYDQAEVTALAAATIALEMLYLFAQQAD